MNTSAEEMWVSGVISSSEIDRLELDKYYVSGTNMLYITMTGVPDDVGLMLIYKAGTTHKKDRKLHVNMLN